MTPQQLDPVTLQVIVQSSQAVIAEAIRAIPALAGVFVSRKKLTELTARLEAAQRHLRSYQALASMNHNSLQNVRELNATWGALDKTKEHLQATYGAHAVWGVGGRDAKVRDSLVSQLSSNLNDALLRLGVVSGSMPAIFQIHRPDVRSFMHFHAQHADSLRGSAVQFQAGLKELMLRFQTTMDRLRRGEIDEALDDFFEVAPVIRFGCVLEPLTEVQTMILQSVQNQFVDHEVGGR